MRRVGTGPSRRRWLGRCAAPALVALALAALAGCGGSSGDSTTGASTSAANGQKTYKMVFSNSFAGNDWRQELEALAAASVKYPPFKGRIDYKLVRSDNSATAQITSLNNIILEHPDAIIIEPSSPTALNQVIARACAQKIVVVTVDANVTAPCAYQVSTNWYNNGLIAGKWLGKAMGGRGSVFLDRGLAGVSLAADLLRGYKDGLKDTPAITVAGEFNSEFALGPEQAGVASLLAAHPDVGGIAASGYGVGAIKALQAAGKPLVPVAGYSYNTSMLTCARAKGAKCVLATNAPYLAVQGMKIALDVLDGKQVQKRTFNTPTFFTNTDITVPGAKFEQIKLGENALPDQPPGLFLPYKPPFMPDMTLEDALGSSKG